MSTIIEKNTELTTEDKRLFGYFGEHAKIRPPFRILNPERIIIGDYVSIREEMYLHAYTDLSFLMDYVDPQFRGDLNPDDYRYEAHIKIDREVQIGRNFFISCTNHVEIGRNVTISERVFVGDNNHTYSHPNVPIMQQPNQAGRPVRVGPGSWVGVGVAILAGSQLGRNNVVGANSVVQGIFPDYAVIGTEPAKLLHIKPPAPGKNQS
jgi:acetyltransferase-like isoleucine patch superfamily enzyme